MCGIVGIISKVGSLPFHAMPLFTNLLRMDSVRGDDSTGCFGVTSSGHVDMLKGDTDGYQFTTTEPYWEFAKRIDKNYRVVIGHNRKATSGEITATNAHPFQHKHIMMVHNGAIKNAKGIAETEVDSEAIAHALAAHDPVTALGKLDGAYAIVWYDESDHTISLARNKERPLWLLEYAGTWVISSEPGLPMWLQLRDGRKQTAIAEVPTERIWTFNVDQLSKGYYEIAYEEYKAWTKPVQPSFTSYPQYPSSGEDMREPMVTPFRKKSNPYRAGDKVIFSLADEKVESGAQVILGHPLDSHGEQDESVFMRVVLKGNDDFKKYFGLDEDPTKNFTNALWQATVMQTRELAGILTVYCHEFQPYQVVKDHNGAETPTDEVAEAIKDGCNKCSKTVTQADVTKGILRKKKDGSWRVVCPSCVSLSIMEANNAKPGLNLRVQ